jgi:Zn-dependent protease with chaperone function
MHAPVSKAAAIAVSFLIAGCATQPAGTLRNSWTPTEAWWTNGGRLVARDGTVRVVDAARAQNLRIAYGAISKVSGVRAQLSLVDIEGINATSSEEGGQGHVWFTLSLVDQLGNDPDALAAIAGHELAHLYFHHGAARKARAATAMGASQALGTLLNALLHVPVGGLIAGTGTQAVVASYSRDEEREADMKGLEWAKASGFSACGLARAMRLIEKSGASGQAAFLATHPGTGERIERATAFAGSPC